MNICGLASILMLHDQAKTGLSEMFQFYSSALVPRNSYVIDVPFWKLCVIFCRRINVGKRGYCMDGCLKTAEFANL